MRTGGHLVIETDVFMGIDNRIEVERGAKLEIIKGRVTNACEGMPWRGIFVHGNVDKEQPDPTAVPGDDLEFDDSGIVFIRKSTIEYADAAIRTDVFDPPFYAFQTARWGGLIDAENCTFSNNRVGVGFMRYEKENKSKFINCRFQETNDQVFPINGSHGVTIWRCDKIIFERCTFRDLDAIGIESQDAGYTVQNRNQFLNMTIGIRATASTPLAPQINIIGTSGFCTFPFLDEQRNLFSSNDTHILLRGGEAFRYIITNNSFRLGNYGVRASTPTSVGVSFNSFFGTRIGVNYDNTFGESASVTCNEFSVACIGVLARGVNYGTDDFGQIGLNFNGNSYNQFFGRIGFKLTDFNGFPGIIPDQGDGSSGLPALNCFDNFNLTELMTEGDTESFNYASFGLQNHCTFVQKNNVGTDNYSLSYHQTVYDPCDVDIKLVSTEIALQDTRETLEYYRNSLLNEPNNEEHKALYNIHFNKKEELLAGLIRKKINDGLFDQAENLLEEESIERRIKWGYNIKLIAKDYNGAAALLNQLDNNNLENQNFVKTQEIVLESEISTEVFSLSPLQTEELITIAEGNGKNSGFAMTLLEQYAENYEAPNFECLTADCNCIVELEEDTNSSLDSNLNNEFSIYPNPANKTLNLEYSSSNDKLKTVRIFTIDGKLVSSLVLRKPGLEAINVEGFPAGIYIINIEEDGKTTFHDKFTIVRY